MFKHEYQNHVMFVEVEQSDKESTAERTKYRGNQHNIEIHAAVTNRAASNTDEVHYHPIKTKNTAYNPLCHIVTNSRVAIGAALAILDFGTKLYSRHHCKLVYC
jgi:hypothetical protein